MFIYFFYKIYKEIVCDINNEKKEENVYDIYCFY